MEQNKFEQFKTETLILALQRGRRKYLEAKAAHREKTKVFRQHKLDFREMRQVIAERFKDREMMPEDFPLEATVDYSEEGDFRKIENAVVVARGANIVIIKPEGRPYLVHALLKNIRLQHMQTSYED